MDAGGEQFARLDHFAALVAENAAGVPLDLAALAIAGVLRSRDPEATLATLDELAAGCPEPTFEGLRRHLYDELDFRGPAGEYDDPRHSMLDLVVAHRRGLPILLATVMIEVGRRAGIPVVGIGMPMHFLVRSAGDPEAFVDPVTGDAFDRRGAQRRFETMTGGRVPWDDRHLSPTSSRLIVVRMLTNLRASYERRRDPVHLALVARMRASMLELQAETGDAVRLSAVFN
ncbi:MAG: transglutaminase-like domain-containing protein [Ilumatobacteraceae bacterium]